MVAHANQEEEADYLVRCRLPVVYFPNAALLSERGLKVIVRKRVPLVMEAVKPIFESAETQHEALEALYRIALGSDFTRAARIEGWPRIHPDDHRLLSQLFVEFDHKHHPDVMPGSLWFNRGFFADETVPLGYIDLSGLSIHYTPVADDDRVRPGGADAPAPAPEKQREEEKEEETRTYPPCLAP